MDWAIRLDRVGKLYPIGGGSALNGSLRDDATQWFRGILGRKSTPSNPDQSRFWALRDISLEVAKGEVLGIVGRNGAGKSTLLKILARITPPSTGSIQYRGHLGALLEIGTGFHRELTGRENIFLNGSILGMRRDEIAAKLDEIVAFAEVEKFLDAPVKFYSSGMYVRLAFAVAAHLDTDILLVDEVLAVGDVRFQKKCLGKMETAARADGRTVVFVSHNMNAVQRLCSRGVLLEQGRVACTGSSREVVSAYLSACGSQAAGADVWIELDDVKRFGTGQVQFSSVRYRSDQAAIGFRPYPEGPIQFTMVLKANRPTSVASVAATFYTAEGTKLVNADTISLGHVIRLNSGISEVQLTIKQLHLNPGSYILGLYLADPQGVVFDHIESAFEISVADVERNKLGQRPVQDGTVFCDFEFVELHHHADRR